MMMLHVRGKQNNFKESQMKTCYRFMLTLVSLMLISSVQAKSEKPNILVIWGHGETVLNDIL